MPTDTQDVVVIGGGVAGLTAAIFTARAGLSTLVVDAGESILARNAHLENVPGFPAGVDARLFLEMTRDQAERAGSEFREDRVTDLDRAGDGHLSVEMADADASVAAEVAIAASWSDAAYLADLDVSLLDRGSKTYVDVDERGRTGVEGVYAAGRIAGQPHQTAVAAGHGATVALAVLEDSERPFYHDWVAPAGYFTERDREVPPGCEELEPAEYRRRERESLAVMREYLAEPHPDEPTQHPSVAGED